MDTNCKNNIELLWASVILVKSNTFMLYWSIQTVSQAETKGSVYTKMAGINITRRIMYYILYHWNNVWLRKLFKWFTKSLEKIIYQI